MATIRALARSRATDLERRPPFEPGKTLEEVRSRSYPVDRGLDGYGEQLPGLMDALRSGLSILDVGAGEGIAAVDIRDSLDCSVTATGIAPLDSSRVPLVVAEADDLPFESDRFDLVLSVHGLSWCPDQRTAIEECIRVAQPGGIVLLSLITFSASVDIWYGDQFWRDAGIDRQEWKEFDFDPEWQFDGCDALVVPQPAPGAEIQGEVLRYDHKIQGARVSDPTRHTRYQGAIIRDHHILLITHHEHRSGRFYWVIPGGGRELPESEEECVIREMQEETNLTVRIERLLLDKPAPKRGVYQRHKTYLCAVLGGEAAPGAEPEPDVAARYSITDVQWFDLRDHESWDQSLQADTITRPQVEMIRAELGYT